MRSMPRLPAPAHPFKPRAGMRLVFGGAFASITVAAWAQTPPSTSAAEAPPAASAAQAQTPPDTELPTIVVVGTTPLVGVGTPLEKVPANVQTIKGSEIEAQHTPTIANYLEKNVVSVDTNDAQGNPWQTDINYRGFTA